MNESPIQKTILAEIGSRPDVRLFRNNVGLGVCGKIVRRLGDEFLIRHGRVVKFGLHVGSGDLIGWQTRTITPEMVGKKIAVFLSIETKSDTGEARSEQVTWRDGVISCGGISGVCRCVDDVLGVLDQPRTFVRD